MSTFCCSAGTSIFLRARCRLQPGRKEPGRERRWPRWKWAERKRSKQPEVEICTSPMFVTGVMCTRYTSTIESVLEQCEGNVNKTAWTQRQFDDHGPRLFSHGFSIVLITWSQSLIWHWVNHFRDLNSMLFPCRSNNLSSASQNRRWCKRGAPLFISMYTMTSKACLLMFDNSHRWSIQANQCSSQLQSQVNTHDYLPCFSPNTVMASHTG